MDLGIILTAVGLLYTISSGITVTMFWLFKNGLDKQFKALDDKVKYDREESKDEDQKVNGYVERVDNLRVDQITKLHERVGASELRNGQVAERVAYLEGFKDGSEKK